jgi:hypothetical protein
MMRQYSPATLAQITCLVPFFLCAVCAAEPPSKAFPGRMPLTKPTDRPLSAAMSRLYDLWSPTAVLQQFGLSESDHQELNSTFRYTRLEGLDYSENTSRRDPSKVLRIDGTYFVWYTRRKTVSPPLGPDMATDTIPSADWDLADIAYATSQDGFTWQEQGVAIPRPPKPKLADNDAIALVGGHTNPILGADKVKQVLADYRNAVQFIHDKTVEGMNKGMTPDELVQYVELPDNLASKDYLQPFYGHPEWGIRSVFNGYLGWFDGNATNLFPLSPKSEAARRIPAKPFEIPYRCLVPKSVRGLLFAGRCISGAHEAHASYRVTGTCMGLGQAAGLAAAIAVDARTTPDEIDGRDLRAALEQRGAKFL